MADIRVVVADRGGDLLQHSGTVVADNGEFYWVSGLCRTRDCSARSSPSDVDSAVRLIHEVGDVGTRFRVNRNALAPSYVTNNFFTTDRIAAACPINQQLIVSLDFQRSAIVAEDLADHAANQSCLFLRLWLGAIDSARSKLFQDGPGRKLAVPN